jgi:hypothetical protein
MQEASFADAIARIANAADLPEAKRIHWTCSLRKIAAALQKPVEAVPARWTAIRFAVGELHHLPLGMEAKTLSNHRANVKSALAWFSAAADVPTRGAPLSPSWHALLTHVAVPLHRKGLLSFMRFCSGAEIGPGEVDDAVVDRFMAYRAEHTRLKAGIAARRSLGRAWNACRETVPDWPRVRLTEPALPSRGLAFDDLPTGLQEDVEQHLNGLKGLHRSRRRQAAAAQQAFDLADAACRDRGLCRQGGCVRVPADHAYLAFRRPAAQRG